MPSNNPLNMSFNQVRVHYEKAVIQLQNNPKLRNDLKIGGFGILLGVILGGLMAKMEAAAPANITSSPGWNPVHVFYGKMNHLYDPIPEQWYLKNSPVHSVPDVSREWFGQHGQDIAVAKFLNFKKKGFFVDLGANDAVWASNTFALEQNFDWKGICIEANPVYWNRLAFRTNCQVAGVMVGKKDMEEVKANLPLEAKGQGPFGGIIGAEYRNKPKEAILVKAQPRYTVSLMHILKKFNAPKVIDYLSLDVTGAEGFVLKDFPFHKPYTFKVITIATPNDKLKKALIKAGYEQVSRPENRDTMWAHKSVYAKGQQRVAEIDEETLKKTHVLEGFPAGSKPLLR